MTENIRKIAFLGDYLPRKCGIATFTKDLHSSIVKEFPTLHCSVVSVNDVEEGYDYPTEVRFEITEQDLPSYLRAADFLNITDVDVISVQHEFGIFARAIRESCIGIATRITRTIVTTLHTILRKPSSEQRRVMHEPDRLSTRLVVMTEQGRQLLQEVYQAPPTKIDLIPHGYSGYTIFRSKLFQG